ncbi:uncharacterized protein [Watersipora subatra]|uniref:uncharacterized protein n=1 Tax=Watersipora subatra TaxID=2589382 RepID=UPI00355C3657
MNGFTCLRLLTIFIVLIESCNAGFNMAVLNNTVAQAQAQASCEIALYDFYCDFRNLLRGRNKNCAGARQQFNDLKHSCESTDVVRRTFQVVKYTQLFTKACNIPFPDNGCNKFETSLKKLFSGKRSLKLKCNQDAHWNGMKDLQDAQKDGCKFAMSFEQEVLYQVAPQICLNNRRNASPPRSAGAIVPRRCGRV